MKQRLRKKQQKQQQAAAVVNKPEVLPVQEAWDQLWGALHADPVWKGHAYCLFISKDWGGAGRLHSANGPEVLSRITLN